MTEETITILKVGTDEAIKSVNDLRSNVKALKDRLGDLEIGTTEYQDTLEELKVNQNALKDAMYATSTSMSDLSKSAAGTSETYNSLVHRMASLKEELRATDVSTEQGKQAFKQLAQQVNDVNDKLKEMDALQGNYQRNVGNYKSALSGIAHNVDALDKGFKAMSGNLGAVKGGFEALSASPSIGTFAIILSVIVKVAGALKDNEKAAEGFKKGLNALKPVMDFVAGVLDKLATLLVDIIARVSEFVTSNGLFSKIIGGVMGVGNAILQFIIAPFKGIVEAIGILKEEGIKGLKNAAKAFGEEMKSGISFRQNFETGQTVADTIISGAQSRRQSFVDAGKEMAEAISEGIEMADWEKALDQGEKTLAEKRRQRLAEQKELDAEIEAEYQRSLDEIDTYFEEEQLKEDERLKKEEERAKAKVQMWNEVGAATSGILSTLADLYESDEKASKKNAAKIKALRIASATIETIQGALTAYTQAQQLGPIAGPIVGALNAAAVTATGVAQIAQIRKTKIEGETSSSGTTSSITSAVASAPALETQVSNVRSITTASEEERLNQMASPMRAYILSSDIEASSKRIKMQVAESSF